MLNSWRFISKLYVTSHTESLCMSSANVYYARENSLPFKHTILLDCIIISVIVYNFSLGTFIFSVFWAPKWGLLKEAPVAEHRWPVKAAFSISNLFLKYHNCFSSHLTSYCICFGAVCFFFLIVALAKKNSWGKEQRGRWFSYPPVRV